MSYSVTESTDLSMDIKEQSNLYGSVDPDEVVITGIAGRFPGSNNINELKENLLNKMDLGTSSHNRWSNGNVFPFFQD